MSTISEEEIEGETLRLSKGSTTSSGRSHSQYNHNQLHDHDYEHDQNEAYSSASGEEGDEGDENDSTFPPQPPLSQHAFAPPFYGRPPTPLPPSPSLTSLLRPSRPTTPDASDDDHHHHHYDDHPHSDQHRSHHHHHDYRHYRHHHHHHHPSSPLPRARPKVPTHEYYGFVLYLFSSFSFVIYLLWSYLPSPFLHALGIYYYPNRWWSLAIPSFLVMLLLYIYVALAGYNTEYLTLRMESVETVVDEAAMVAVVDREGRIVREKRREGKKGGGEGKGAGRQGGKGKQKGVGREEEVEEVEEGVRVMSPGEKGGLDWRKVWDEGTDAVMDVPLAGVCEVLYGEGRQWESEDEDGDVVITRV